MQGITDSFRLLEHLFLLLAKFSLSKEETAVTFEALSPGARWLHRGSVHEHAPLTAQDSESLRASRTSARHCKQQHAPISDLNTFSLCAPGRGTWRPLDGGPALCPRGRASAGPLAQVCLGPPHPG